MKLVVGACSRTGLVRSINEDAMLIRTADGGALFLAADGIGGREHGEIVSGMLRDGYARWWGQRFLPANVRMTFPGAIGGDQKCTFSAESRCSGALWRGSGGLYLGPAAPVSG